jgi:predicted transglutaminase-like cysteine proteinase
VLLIEIIAKTRMKRTLILAAALLSIAASSSFGDALLFTVPATPYDNQMARIRAVLTAPSRASSNRVSLSVVNQWMGDLRSIPYGFTARWKTPAEARSGAPADCKAKAVALYEKMQRNGATNVRLVIGKRTSSSRQTHAWLAWDTQNDSYVLDPTFNWIACRTGQIGDRNYQPLYAFAGKKKFRAASTLIAQN